MQVPQLRGFFEAIQDDNRIAPSHISVYMALFDIWNGQDFQNPIPINRRGVMRKAKISGVATFHKCMRDLHAFGYIHYRPSFNPALNSKVWLLKV